MLFCLLELNIVSGFKPDDSCDDELLAITHEIYSSFNGTYNERVIFVDILKAFGKVWYEGIIHKLQQLEISGNLLNLFTNFLKK